jgi:hypothetical protein
MTSPEFESNSGSSSGPGTERQRRLTETDVDPSGDLASDKSGETDDAGTGRPGDNQPAESHENPSRSENHQTEGRDSENAPKPGHEE